MALTVLPARQPGAFASFGAGFGQGLSSGIQTLVDYKIKELQERKAGEQNERSLVGLGIPAPEAKQIAQIKDPVLQRQFVNNYLQAPANQALIDTLGFGQAAQQESPYGQAPVEGGYKPMQPGITPPSGVQTPQAQPNPLAGLSRQQLGSLDTNLLFKLDERRQKEQALEYKRQQTQLQKEEKLSRDEANKIAKENTAAIKETKAYRHDLSTGSEKSQGILETASDMLKLNRSGKIHSYAKGWIQGPDTKEWLGLATKLANAVEKSPGKAKQLVEKLFDPNLSPAVREKSLNNLIKEAGLPILKKNIADDIIEKNNGIPPINLEKQVDDEVKKVNKELRANPDLMKNMLAQQQAEPEATAETIPVPGQQAAPEAAVQPQVQQPAQVAQTPEQQVTPVQPTPQQQAETTWENLGEPLTAREQMEAENASLNKIVGSKAKEIVLPKGLKGEEKEQADELKRFMKLSPAEAQKELQSKGKDNLKHRLEGVQAASIKGALTGVTSLGTTLPKLFNLVSLGHIPVPEMIKALDELPEKTVKKIFGEIAGPKNEGEAFQRKVAEEIFSFLSPTPFLGAAGKAVGAIGKGSSLLSKSAGWLDKASKLMHIPPKELALMSGTSELLSWLVKDVTGSEAAGTATKIGSMLAIPLMTPTLAKFKVASLGRQIEHELPATAKIPGGIYISDKANRLFRALKNEESPIVTKLQSQVEKFVESQFKAKPLADIKTTLTDPEFLNILPKRGKVPQKAVSELNKVIDHSLTEVSKGNPKLSGLVTDYIDLSNAGKITSTLGKWVTDNITYKPKNPLISLILAGMNIGLPRQIRFGAAAAGKGAEYAQRIYLMTHRSPAFRKYYGNFITASLSGSGKAATNAVKNLDKVADFEEGRV